MLKGLNWGQGGFHDRPVRNVRVHNNVIWCDWGRALEIGAETSAPEIANVRFQDCDIIRTTHIAMDVQCGDRALVHDIRYENIRVETDDVCPAPRMQGSRDERYMEDPKDQYVPNLLVIVISKNPYSKDPERGNVRDVTYAGVSVTGRRAPRSFFNGLDAQHTVQGVTPWPASPEAIELFQVLKPVGAFESCRFADWQNQAVTIRGARSASAIYSRPYESWLVLGNLNESAQEVGVVLHPDKLPYLFRQR